ncbi:unnamed protein product [Schistosoma curassoni]|uniref:Sodium/myo-inositol cotransporter n=1 Tax=Schistosoma curassoni TaxID=6186 RepID=A0A183JW65_9TREM|nr:unnamed protein product [Schistosoma curassoni]
MTWLPVGASLFASNIGSEHFIGLAGSGAAAGIAVGAFELNMVVGGSRQETLEPGFVLFGTRQQGVPVILRDLVLSGGFDRLSSSFTARDVTTEISEPQLTSCSLFLTEALKWNTWASIVMLLFLTGLITVTGGLAAVLYTDTLQFFVMIIGALILAIISYINVGGFSGVLSSYGHAIAPINISSSTDSDIIISLANVLNTTNYTSLTQLASSPDVPSSLRCSLPPENAFVLLRGIDDPDMPWLGFLLGQTPASIWYWCTDQMMVQRVLAAKSLSHAQGATLMAGLIKQLPLFLIVIPGMISRILFPDVIGCKPGPDCYRICGQKSGCSNLAYPKLVINIMPSGLRGLMLAVMLAALISDLTSIFNSASTLFTVDVYLKIRKKAKNMEIMVVSRIFIIILILLSIAWIPVIQELQGSQLFIYIQAISAYLAPPVASVYLCAVLIKRTTEKGAFYGLMYGLIIGLIRIILTIIYHEPICGEYDHRPWFIKNIHYMYFALFSFITCGIIVCLLSLNEKQLTNEQLQHLTYWTAWDKSINHSLYNNRTLHNHISSNEMIRNNIENVMSENDVNMINNVHYHQYENNEIINKREISSTSECQQQQQQQQKEFFRKRQYCHEKAVSRTSLAEAIYTWPYHDLPDKKTPQTSSSSDWYKIMKNICLWFCGCADHPCSNIERNHCCCLKLCHNFTTHIHPNHKKIYVITSSDVNIADNEKKFGNLVLEDDNNFDSEEHYAKITSLKQDPNVKLGLYIGLLFIIILSIFGFIFFSIYFGSISVGPLPISIDKMMINDTIKNAIKSLETHGLITIQ